ncbi:LacI family DNA-binding transcriptional regulator [Mycoplasmopsis verecunda]|uniref:Transcriptional regulator, LacI family n=1 Tax=Mycoplasmopsis verecunda TaxID=171291 RepID=A0A1T4L8L7_9BACT|nr:LacI family DNA-binding transcriptional regulator [Mycoplasmopsis verecunda]WPB54489.1 LacI family DNA-binding transcriptional regulator [Mycoplasmopsis verecunda]SJZ51079.1 transcriptional regulator, LacI family [Mycoplasmopsis verecunda]
MTEHKKSKQISYKDISTIANVSISTISRYYNGGYVSNKTKRKIASVVKEYEYIPNHGARMIRGKDTSVFAIAPIFGSSLYQYIINGIIAACSRSNKRVITTYSNPSTQEYIETIKYMLSWRPTSLVVFVPEYDDLLFKYLRTIENVAIVVYGYQVDGLSWIIPNEIQGFYDVTMDFYKQLPEDDKKILFLQDRKLLTRQKEKRYAGFLKACQETNAECLKYEISTRKNEKDLKEFIAFAKEHNINNVVCSTHDSFISLATQNQRYFKLTDIGYQSIYDNLKIYSSKIFIDFPLIGLEIENMITNQREKKTLQQKEIDLKLISSVKKD